jgi:hypothetical protein
MKHTLLTLTSLLLASLAAFSQARPNVLLIMADDLRAFGGKGAEGLKKGILVTIAFLTPRTPHKLSPPQARSTAPASFSQTTGRSNCAGRSTPC